MTNRRTFILTLALAAVSATAYAESSPLVTVYLNPT